jgi:hypothetical protein
MAIRPKRKEQSKNWAMEMAVIASEAKQSRLSSRPWIASLRSQ